MEINGRLIQLRNALGLSQEKFGSRIKLVRSAISNYESMKRELPERTIFDICREFNVNEHWLRTGQGKIFIEPDTFTLDEYAQKNNATELECALIKKYFSVNPEVRLTILKEMKQLFDSFDLVDIEPVLKKYEINGYNQQTADKMEKEEYYKNISDGDCKENV